MGRNMLPNLIPVGNLSEMQMFSYFTLNIISKYALRYNNHRPKHTYALLRGYTSLYTYHSAYSATSCEVLPMPRITSVTG